MGEDKDMYTVLLVDDEEEVIQVIMRKLNWEELGFSVDVPEDFSNGYGFAGMLVGDTRAVDENKETVYTFPELAVDYERDGVKDISLYINSPGGSVSAGLAIYDTMNYIKCDVSTICIGMAASMGSFLLAGGAKGKRYALPNAEIMIHQPAGGTQGQATEIDIAAKHILRTREKLNHILAENTGRDYETICSDTERDNWMSAQEAKEYGIVDMVISSHAVQDEKK